MVSSSTLKLIFLVFILMCDGAIFSVKSGMIGVTGIMGMDGKFSGEE